MEGEQRPRPPEPEAPWTKPEPGEPEPDWAEGIRQGRRERGRHLRDVFAAFEEDDQQTRPPA